MRGSGIFCSEMYSSFSQAEDTGLHTDLLLVPSLLRPGVANSNSTRGQKPWWPHLQGAAPPHLHGEDCHVKGAGPVWQDSL